MFRSQLQTGNSIKVFYPQRHPKCDAQIFKTFHALNNIDAGTSRSKLIRKSRPSALKRIVSLSRVRKDIRPTLQVFCYFRLRKHDTWFQCWRAADKIVRRECEAIAGRSGERKASMPTYKASQPPTAKNLFRHWIQIRPKMPPSTKRNIQYPI